VRDQDADHWRTNSNRRPSEASDFTATYLTLRALRKWGGDGQKARIARRIEFVRAWLLKSEGKDTEDRVFRLWAFQQALAPTMAVQAAMRDLVRVQRDDGGWAQTDGLASDAYATGSALVALHEAGGLTTSRACLRARRAFPPEHQTGRRVLARALAEQAVPDLFRERFSARQGPVHLHDGLRLGNHRNVLGVSAHARYGRAPRQAIHSQGGHDLRAQIRHGADDGHIHANAKPQRHRPDFLRQRRVDLKP
jgi:hypothetical protein